MGAPSATLQASRRRLRSAPAPERARATFGVLGTLVVASAVFALAFNSGSYAITARGVVGVVVWWGLALALASGLLPLAPVPRAALVAGGFLAGLALLSGLSIAWSDSAETAFTEANRVLLYLGAFALVALTATRTNLVRWIDGIGIGILAVAILALVARLFPHLIDAATDSSPYKGDPRASWPLDYWNGLALFVALGIAPLLRAALAARHAVTRAAAVAALPLLASTIYLTSSRGGAVIAVVVGAAYVALSRERGRALVAALVGGAGSAVALVVLAARSALVDNPLSDPAAIGQGHSAAVILAAICLATGVAYLLANRFSIRLPRLSRRVAAVLGALAVAALAVAVVAGNPGERFAEFKTPPDQTTEFSSHLASGSGSGRWQFWSAAFDQFEAHPVLGDGAGSFPAWWLEHGKLRYFTRNAHSLYLQTLGELGLVGLALLLGALATAALATTRRLRGPPEGREELAAVAAIAVGFVLGAALDWIWQIPAIALLGIAALALLTGAATARDGAPPRIRWPWRVAILVVGAAAVVSAAIPLLTQTEIERSQARAARYDIPGALARADDARDIQPWAASPYLQLALVHEASGDPFAAEAALDDAIERDPSDWRVWLVAARVAHRRGAEGAADVYLRRATELNPRSPLIEAFRRSLLSARR